MQEGLREALEYLGVTVGRAMQGLPESEAVRMLVGQVLVNLWKEEIRPAPKTRVGEWKQRMKAQGRCIDCGKPVWRDGAALCLHHLEYRRNYRRSRKKTP